MVRYGTAQPDIVVIGAGAGGMMAAGRAAELDAAVLVLEKMSCPGKKMLISGKMRCNVTNARELDDFISMYGVNGRFLYHAFSRFFRDDLLKLLKRYGVATQQEEDGRIFPVSNNAHDVVKALQRFMADHGVQVHTESRVRGIKVAQGRVTGIMTDQGVIPAPAVILATGGASYPGTGSSGDGYRMAAEVGHTIVKLRPSLVPFVVSEAKLAQRMQGVSLRQVRLTAYRSKAEEVPQSLLPATDCGRGTGQEYPPHPIIESRRGDMVLTHFGISGPVVLQMSLAIVDALEKGPVSVAIDLKPDIPEKQLHQIMRQEFDRHGKRGYRRILSDLLPPKMVEPFLEMTAISPDRLASQISLEERKRLVSLLKSFRFTVKKPLPVASAMVTAGGVSLKEIEPRTMASKLVQGLYFCGEVMDIDADTGGYNLTAAFSTGYVAGESAAAYARSQIQAHKTSLY